MEQLFNQAEIILRWRNLDHLELLRTNVFHMPERIYAYSDTLFVVYNHKKKSYEIHSIANGPGMNSKELDIPYSELDARALWWLWEHDLRVHGKEIFRRLEQGEEDAKRRNHRKFLNWSQDMASETRTLFARDAWGDGGKLQFQSAGVGKRETGRDRKTGGHTSAELVSS